MLANIKVFVVVVDAIRKASLVALEWKKISLKYHLDVQPVLCKKHPEFHPDQLRSVQESELQNFCFLLTL